MFGYVEGGYARVLTAFRAHLARGVRTLVWHAVRSGARPGAIRVDVQLAGGETASLRPSRADRPLPPGSRPCARSQQAERTRLANVVYQGIACASVLLRRPLGGLLHHQHHRAAGALHRGHRDDGSGRPPHFGGTPWSICHATCLRMTRSGSADEEIRDDFRRGPSHACTPTFGRAMSRIPGWRVREMLARHHPELLRRSPGRPWRTSLPNVFIVNSAQIANGTLNVNETVGLAEAGAPRSCLLGTVLVRVAALR